MDSILVRGNGALSGAIPIAGAKNACLTLMPATLLSDEPLTLTNAPRLSDIAHDDPASAIAGAEVASLQDGLVLALSSHSITNFKADYDIVRKMRASILVLGPMLARYGHAEVSLPGGCAIGARPVDLHLKALEAMGAELDLRDGYVHAKAPGGRLKGAVVDFPFVSVGATENALMAATLAKGHHGPEERRARARDCRPGPLPEEDGREDRRRGDLDHHHRGHRPAGRGDASGGDRPDRAWHLHAGPRDLRRRGGMHRRHAGPGAKLRRKAGCSRGFRDANQPRPEGCPQERAGAAVDVTTEPFPGFPTDLQAQMMALLCTAEGTSVLEEKIFENRFMHAPELIRMGAKIDVHGGTATVTGVEKLKGAPVMATDLRASVSLILAGLAAEGETVVSRVYHLDRGYERVEEKLRACGAHIERIQA
jgi:UDP-N-acetylglucosamine 1-carboxyvinyltransferase